MYERFYGLTRTPFAVTPDPAMLFMSKLHREALATILYGVETRKGFIVCTGEVGTGKSTIVRAFFDQVRAEAVKLIYIFTPQVSPLDMARYICGELGLAEPDSVFAAVPRLQLKLLEEFEAGRTVVLMIDEAQLLPPETLEFLRLLSNFETDTEKLVQIVLVGQPEVDEMLARRDMRQVNQRVALRARLGAFGVEESLAYIEHRLRVSGAEEMAQVMSPSAGWLIAETAGGIPRVINILADNALIAGFGMAQRPLGSQLAGTAIREYLGKAEAPKPERAERFASGWRALARLRGAVARDRAEPDEWVATALPPKANPRKTAPSKLAATARLGSYIARPRPPSAPATTASAPTASSVPPEQPKAQTTTVPAAPPVARAEQPQFAPPGAAAAAPPSHVSPSPRAIPQGSPRPPRLMSALDPAIHEHMRDVDARIKSGHDELKEDTALTEPFTPEPQPVARALPEVPAQSARSILPSFSVMAGLDPAIHALDGPQPVGPEYVDARHKAGYDERGEATASAAVEPILSISPEPVSVIHEGAVAEPPEQHTIPVEPFESVSEPAPPSPSTARVPQTAAPTQPVMAGLDPAIYAFDDALSTDPEAMETRHEAGHNEFSDAAGPGHARDTLAQDQRALIGFDEPVGAVLIEPVAEFSEPEEPAVSYDKLVVVEPVIALVEPEFDPQLWGIPVAALDLALVEPARPEQEPIAPRFEAPAVPELVIPPWPKGGGNGRVPMAHAPEPPPHEPAVGPVAIAPHRDDKIDAAIAWPALARVRRGLQSALRDR